MKDAESNDPLHGINLETILTRLVERYGWDGLGGMIDIRCFNNDPSIKSSLKFLRRTPWARKKLETLYLSMEKDVEKKGERVPEDRSQPLNLSEVKMNILVRNLSRNTTEKELMVLFKSFGQVDRLNLVKDKETGKSKGFGFVEMPYEDEAMAAIEKLNGQMVGGNKIRVKKAEES
jgi:uncharacterized protein (DUF2132 family)